MSFLGTLFSKTGFWILLYILIGIAVGPPSGSQGKLPLTAATGASLHGWIQFLIWILFWPLGLLFHHLAFTL